MSLYKMAVDKTALDKTALDKTLLDKRVVDRMSSWRNDISRKKIYSCDPWVNF
jgi:hypothetical protein